MPCERTEFEHKGEKVVAIICTRGRRRWCKCGKPATQLCDYPKPSKKKRDKTCDLALCVGCSINVGPDRDLCGEHAKTVRAIGWPADLLTNPDPYAMQVVADIVEQREVLKPCVAGDGAEAIANLERTLPKDEAGSFVTRRRSDVFDTEAVDFMLARADFTARNYADWKEFVTERAAIFEYLGEMPRAVADLNAHHLAGRAPRHGAPR